MNEDPKPLAARRTTGRWLNRNIVGLGFASLLSDWNHEMATALLPVFLSSVLGAPAYALGLIEGVADGVATLFYIGSGWYSDRIGRRKGLALAGYLLTALSKATFALAGTWWQVLLGRTAAWIGWAVRSPVRDALLAESTSPATAGRAFAFHRSLDTLGAILGPLTATVLVARVPLRAIFLVSLVPGLLAVLTLALVVRERSRVPIAGHPWHRLKTLPRPLRRFMIPVGLFGMANFAPTLLILRAQDLLSPTLGATAGASAAVGLYTFSNVVGALVAYPIGALGDRVSRQAILAVGFLLFAVLCAGFTVVGAEVRPLGLLFAVAGVSTAIVEAVQPALASSLMREDQHGAGFGLMSTVDGAGDFVSSIAMGLLWSAVSPVAGFTAAAVVSLLAAVVLAAIRLQPAVQA